LMETPFSGGVSAFCAISDNYFLPQLEGVKMDRKKGLITTNTLLINSLGNIEQWQLCFKCARGFEATAKRIRSPKSELRELKEAQMERKVKDMANDEMQRLRLKQFFVNEYYPAIIHTGSKMVVLEKTIESMIARGVFSEHDRDIVTAAKEAVPEWFTGAV